MRSKLAPLNGIEIRHEPRRGYAPLFAVAAPARRRRRQATGRAENVVDIAGHELDQEAVTAEGAA